VKARRRDAIIQAWYIGSFVGFAKQRPLQDLIRKLDGPQERQQMTPDEVHSVMGLWAVAMTGRGGQRAAVQ
jgi:hypothetical protein